MLFGSVAVLLTHGANSPQITGRLERRLPDGRLVHSFHCDVVWVYEMPTEDLLERACQLFRSRRWGRF